MAERKERREKRRRRTNLNSDFLVPFHVSDGFGQTRLILSVFDNDYDPRHSPNIFTHRNLRILVVIGGQYPQKGFVCGGFV